MSCLGQVDFPVRHDCSFPWSAYNMKCSVVLISFSQELEKVILENLSNFRALMMILLQFSWSYSLHPICYVSFIFVLISHSVHLQNSNEQWPWNEALRGNYYEHKIITKFATILECLYMYVHLYWTWCCHAAISMMWSFICCFIL